MGILGGINLRRYFKLTPTHPIDLFPQIKPRGFIKPLASIIFYQVRGKTIQTLLFYCSKYLLLV